MGTKGKDFIDKVIEGKKVPSSRRAKHKMTLTIDHEVWKKSWDELDGQYGALLEGAILEYMERIGKPIDLSDE